MFVTVKEMHKKCRHYMEKGEGGPFKILFKLRTGKDVEFIFSRELTNEELEINAPVDDYCFAFVAMHEELDINDMPYIVETVVVIDTRNLMLTEYIPLTDRMRKDGVYKHYFLD